MEMLSSDSAMAVARYLAANLAFSQCADICLMQVTSNDVCKTLDCK